MSQSLGFQDLPDDIIYMICDILQDRVEDLRSLWQLDRRCYLITLPKIRERISTEDLSKLTRLLPSQSHQMHANLVRILEVKRGSEQTCSQWTLPALQYLHIGSEVQLCMEWFFPLLSRSLQRFRCDRGTFPIQLLESLCKQCLDLQSCHLCGSMTNLANGISLGKVLECLTNLRSIDLTGTSEATDCTFF